MVTWQWQLANGAERDLAWGAHHAADSTIACCHSAYALGAHCGIVWQASLLFCNVDRQSLLTPHHSQPHVHITCCALLHHVRFMDSSGFKKLDLQNFKCGLP